MRSKLLIFFLLALIVICFDRGFWNTFFQQDEWNGFGTVISLSHQPFFSWFHILGAYHFIPFSQLFYLFLYKTFGFQAQFYAMTSLLLHVIASFLVYLLSRKLSGKNWIGVITAILFAVNANASQAYLHLAIFPATITSFIAILLFALVLIYLHKKNSFSFMNLVFLLGFFLLAIGLREDGLILLFLFPLWLFLFRKDFLNKKNKWFFITFASVLGLFFIFRILLQVFTPHVIAVANTNYWLMYMGNIFWFFPKIIVQNIIDGNSLFMFVWWLVQKTISPEVSVQTVLSIYFNIACVLIFLMYVGLVSYSLKRTKNTVVKKNLIFSIGWIIAFSLLLATVGRKMDILEPRYLYLPSFGVIFSLAMVVWSFFDKKTMNKRSLLKAGVVFVLVLISILSSYLLIRRTINVGIYQGAARKTLLKSLIVLYPVIPQRAIFFVRCKELCYRNSEFGLPNDIVLPFSSGPGYIMLLHYAKNNESAYTQFFKKDNKGIEFLWDYGSEGYKQIGDYAFGYFIHEELLKKTVQKEKININEIIGLEYNERTFTFRDISSEVRKEIYAESN